MAKPVDTQKHLMRDAFYGILIGSACGDACGFFFEGMTADQVSSSGKDILRFHILGPTGFISDDTELLAITARALITAANNDDLFHEHFKEALLAWFFTLPFGIGRGTYQACLKIMCGAHHTGSRSAGNGPALRAAIIGAYFFDDRDKMQRVVQANAGITHTDRRAVQAAMYVAALAADATNALMLDTELNWPTTCKRHLEVFCDSQMLKATSRAIDLAVERAVSQRVAAQEIGTTGFAVHALPWVVYNLCKNQPIDRAICDAVTGGGDTDSNAALVASLIGAARGGASIPPQLYASIDEGPFRPKDLAALANLLSKAKSTKVVLPRCNWLHMAARNLCLIPVLLFHATMRLVKG